MLVDFHDDVVPLLMPGKGNSAVAIRLVLMKSKDDKDLFEVIRKFLSFLAPENFFLFS